MFLIFPIPGALPQASKESAPLALIFGMEDSGGVAPRQDETRAFGANLGYGGFRRTLPQATSESARHLAPAHERGACDFAHQCQRRDLIFAASRNAPGL